MGKWGSRFPGISMRKIICCLLLLASWNAFARGPDEGKPAPGLEGRYLSGTAFSLQDMRGKVVIVNFWAAWCPPCREEMPALDGLYKLYHNQGLEIIGISIDGKADEPNVKAVAHSYSYPVALLEAVKADEFGRIWRLPMTFIIDRHGIVRKSAWYCEPKNAASELEKIIVPLLKEE